MSAADPVAVVLAAGASARLGRPKALVELGGRTVVAGWLETVREAGLGEAVVVTGAHHGPIAAAVEDWSTRLADARASDAGAPARAAGDDDAVADAGAGTGSVELLPHPTWHRGRTGSFARAVRARPGRDLLLCPVDVPRVPARVVAALLAAWRAAEAPPGGWLAPTPDARDAPRRRFGHPVLIGRELAHAALDLAPDAPLRGLRELASPLLALEVDAPQVLEDLDTPADLERLERADGSRAPEA